LAAPGAGLEGSCGVTDMADPCIYLDPGSGASIISISISLPELWPRSRENPGFPPAGPHHTDALASRRGGAAEPACVPAARPARMARGLPLSGERHPMLLADL